MPNTVSAAFNLYRSDVVDLKDGDSDDAKSSRDFLVSQIIRIASTVDDFPRLYDDNLFLPFGSFSRKTKFRPLDDVDLLQLLYGYLGTAIYYSENTYNIRIYDQNAPLWDLTDNGLVNSTRVLNKFKNELEDVPNYKRTEINRRGEAVVVNLNSYPWSFDVVPGFAVSNGVGSTDHYLIPDGYGRWKRTDPRIDQALVTKVNQRHNGKILPLIRIMKYWNKHNRHASTIASYHLETMLLKGFEYSNPISDVKSGVIPAFRILQAAILSTCNDPKGLGEPLDANMAVLDRISFSIAVQTMADRLNSVLISEILGLHENAIKVWQTVFPHFPDYEQ